MVSDVSAMLVATTIFGRAQGAMADITRPEDRARNFGRVGAAFGIGFVIGPALGVLLSIAVCLHKIPEGVTIASIMLAGGQSRAMAIGAGALLGGLTIAGAVATELVAQHHVGYALALPAGHQLGGAMMVGEPRYRYHRFPLREEPEITWR